MVYSLGTDSNMLVESGRLKLAFPRVPASPGPTVANTMGRSIQPTGNPEGPRCLRNDGVHRHLPVPRCNVQDEQKRCQWEDVLEKRVLAWQWGCLTGILDLIRLATIRGARTFLGSSPVCAASALAAPEQPEGPWRLRVLRIRPVLV